MSERIANLISYGVLLNFMSFIAMDNVLGGDALNGKYGGGHYFLNNHGHFTEVSRGVFIYSAVHATSAFLGIAGMLWFGRSASRSKC